MVRQRNIFDPNRIDILTDKADKPEEVSQAKQLIEAHNRGVKVIGVPRSKQKGHSDLPLFKPQNQTKLF